MDNPSTYERQLRWVLWLAILFSFFFNLHAVPLFDVDEGAFSEATREMFERGDFISTYLNGVPRYDKPILIYWLQAASVAVFGLHEFSLRLPSALAASAWVLAVFWFVSRMRTRVLGYYAAIVTALALAVSVIGKAATADALLNLFIVVAMFAVYLFFKERHARYLYAAFAAMGLGFLTKGPIAVLIPTVVSLIFFALRGEWRAWLKAVGHPGGLLIFTVIAAPWYLLQYQKEGQMFIEGFFFHHNLDRFQGSMEQHGGNLFYYLPVVFIATLPFSAVVLKVIANYRAVLRDDLMLYCALWFGFVLIFFSLSGTKLPHYMIYGLTGMLILIALHLTEMQSRWLTLLPVMILAIPMLLLPELLTWATGDLSNDVYLQDVLRAVIEAWDGTDRALVGICIGATVYLMVTQHYKIAHRLFVTGGITWILVSVLLLPTVGAVMQAPVKEAAAIAQAQNLNVVMWHVDVPSFSVYAQRVTPRRKPQPGETVLTKSKYLAELPEHILLYAKNGIVLARLK